MSDTFAHRAAPTTELPFSIISGWLGSLGEAWTVDMLTDGSLRIEVLTDRGAVVATSKHPGSAAKQLDECLMQLAKKIGMEA